MGGENRQNSLNQGTGYSSKAECTGAPAYLEPNSNTMQKPIEGLPVLTPFQSKNNPCHAKVQPIYKGAIVLQSTSVPPTFSANRAKRLMKETAPKHKANTE